jgi:hypothetical protein
METTTSEESDDLATMETRRANLRMLIASHKRAGSLANFARMYDIDYGALAATVNGRAPQRAIIIRLMSVLNIREADFPRLPASMRNMNESAPGRAP